VSDGGCGSVEQTPPEVKIYLAVAVVKENGNCTSTEDKKTAIAAEMAIRCPARTRRDGDFKRGISYNNNSTSTVYDWSLSHSRSPTLMRLRQRETAALSVLSPSGRETS
jgi:hypothetical protein